MKKFATFVVGRLVAGLVVVAPVYLAAFLLSKVVSSLMGLMEPVAAVFPDWMPGARALSLLMVLAVCFVIGLALSSSPGRSIWQRLETGLFEKIPGYALFQSLTRQMTGNTQETAWKPALAEIEDALVPAFIIEELEDGSYTVFVPSIPTPLAGAVYVLPAPRVHPLNVPFGQALKTISQWGSGCGDLVAAFRDAKPRGLVHEESVTDLGNEPRNLQSEGAPAATKTKS